MSQYPNPYSPGPYPQNPYPPGAYPGYPTQPRGFGAGQAAGLIMIIMGVIALLFGSCAGIMAAMFDSLVTNPEFQQAISKLQENTPDVKLVIIVMAGTFFFYAIVAIILGTLLMRRVRVVVMISLVCVILMIVLEGLSVVGSLVDGNIAGVILNMFVGGLHVLVAVLLVREFRNRGAMPGFPPQYHPGYYPQQYGAPMQGYYYPPSAPPPAQSQSQSQQQQPPQT